MVLMSFSAGHETTASLFAACLVSLGSDEPLQEGLRSGAVSVPAYVDEILRLTSPIQYAEYAVGRRIEVAGRHLAEGERLAIMFGLANQDDRAFHDPEALCPGRPERHIAFGVGRHSCPGGVLAEREVAVALRVLLAQFVVTVDAQAVRWADREFIRGPARVPGHVLRVGG